MYIQCLPALRIVRSQEHADTMRLELCQLYSRLDKVKRWTTKMVH